MRKSTLTNRRTTLTRTTVGVTNAASSDHREICAFYHFKQNYSTSPQQQQQQNIATKEKCDLFPQPN